MTVTIAGITMTRHQEEVLDAMPDEDRRVVGVHFGMPVLRNQQGERFVLTPECPAGKKPLLAMSLVPVARPHRAISPC